MKCHKSVKRLEKCRKPPQITSIKFRKSLRFSVSWQDFTPTIGKIYAKTVEKCAKLTHFRYEKCGLTPAFRYEKCEFKGHFSYEKCDDKKD